jgi:predicted peptidase
VNEQYLVFLPDDYFNKARWPVILFLHGQNESGRDLNKVRSHGLPKFVETRKNFPFIVVSPQCLEGAFWSDDEEIQFLDALLAEVLAHYRADPERVYVTGLSMGGYGTWRLAMEYPSRFAAIAPICGGGLQRKAGKIKDLPVWVFHREQDQNVPLDASARMVRALRRHGSDVRFTIYPGQGHDAWTRTYRNPRLYEWFLSHKRASRPK